MPVDIDRLERKRAYKRDWARRNYKGSRHRADYQRRYTLKKKYGITPEQYDAMLEQQGGRCAACGSTKTGRQGTAAAWFVVDHCHETGKVRGLLCHPCNVSIGQAGESAARLRVLADYLEVPR